MKLRLTVLIKSQKCYETQVVTAEIPNMQDITDRIYLYSFTVSMCLYEP